MSPTEHANWYALRTARRLANECRRHAEEFPAAYAFYMQESSRQFRVAREHLHAIRLERGWAGYSAWREAFYEHTA